MIGFFYQLDVQILYFNTFIELLYMFRAVLCSSSGGQIVLVQHLVPSFCLGDCSDHGTREDSRNLWSEQLPKGSGERTLVTCVLNSHLKRVVRGIS